MSTLFLRNRYLLWMTVFILFVMGISAVLTLPRIEDPAITNRFAGVTVRLPGASAERIEALIIEPIERRLEKIREIKKITSSSRQGQGRVQIELGDEITKETAPQAFSLVRDELESVRAELPPNASTPVLEGDREGQGGYTLIAAVAWKGDIDRIPVGTMQRLADHLADELRRLPNTVHVEEYGEVISQLNVTVDQKEAIGAGLTASDISQRIARADSKVPAGTYLGDLRHYSIEVVGDFQDSERVARIPLATNAKGAALFVDDLAQVEKGWFEPQPSVAFYKDTYAIYVAARSTEFVQTDQWVQMVRSKITEVGELTGGDLSIEVVFDQSEYTLARLSDLGGNLLLGGLVVMSVILLIMGWKAALIVGLALPLSFGATLFGLSVLGYQIHQMSIFGMIVALGLLIDNAIVVVDEVRHEIHHLKRGPGQAVSETLRKLFLPLLASTATTVLAFMPIFLLPGATGDFVGSIATSVVLALVSSLFISVTVVASLAAAFTHPQGRAELAWYKEGIHSVQLRRRFRKILLYFIGQQPVLGVLISLVIPVAGFIGATQLPNIFFPTADRDQFQLQVRLDSDTASHETFYLLQDMDPVVRENPHVKQVTWMFGESHPTVYYNLIPNEETNSAFGQAIIKMDSTQAASDYVIELQNILDERFPRAQVITQALGQGPPTPAPVGIRIVGPDPYQLKEYGLELREIMSRHPLVTHTRAQIQSGTPKMTFVPNENKVRLAGLDLNDVADQLSANLNGMLGGNLQEGVEQLPVRVRYERSAQRELDTLASSRLLSPARPGQWIPIDALGDFKLMPDIDHIRHYNGERVNEVYAYLLPQAAPIDVASEVLATFGSEVSLAPNYRVSLAGDAEEQGQAIANLFKYIPVLFAFMATILVLAFSSLMQAALIGAVAVLSLGMGLFSLWLGGYPLGFMPIIGTTGLIGVAINDSIVVLALIRAKRDARRAKPVAITEAVIDTTRHVMGTTLTTMGSFVPLLIFVGGDFWPPLAIVIAGGVGFATLLALLFTPCMYRIMYRRRYSRIEP